MPARLLGRRTGSLYMEENDDKKESAGGPVDTGAGDRAGGADAGDAVAVARLKMYILI